MEASWLCGLVDVGSNTIRGVVYEITGSEFREVANRCDFASLITFVENGLLTPKGCTVLYACLERMADFFASYRCRQMACFATASLRGIGNLAAIQQQVRALGFELQLLSGDEEVRCDFCSLMHQVSAENGVGLDLGGGSGQLFYFEKRQLKQHISCPIGVSAMKKRFSVDLEPGWEAESSLSSFVRQQLAAVPSLQGCGGHRLYGMGGTLRAALYTSRLLWGTGSMPVLTVEQLTALFQALRSPEGRSAALKVDADRLPTLGSGLVVLRTICEYVGAVEIQFIDSSVREGYLWKNIINQP